MEMEKYINNLQRYIEDQVDLKFSYHQDKDGTMYVENNNSKYVKKFRDRDLAILHMENYVKRNSYVVINMRDDKICHIGEEQECKIILEAFLRNDQSHMDVWSLDLYLDSF